VLRSSEDPAFLYLSAAAGRAGAARPRCRRLGEFRVAVWASSPLCRIDSNVSDLFGRAIDVIARAGAMVDDAAAPPEVRFAPDSLLEGAGFEPSVPQQIRSRFRDLSPVLPDGLATREPNSSNPSPFDGEPDFSKSGRSSALAVDHPGSRLPAGHVWRAQIVDSFRVDRPIPMCMGQSRNWETGPKLPA
jgi:hypothetical protein